MLWFRKKIQRQLWTDIQIDLYERQMAAREAMGLKWKCHPANASLKIRPTPAQPYIGYDVVNIPTVYPPKLTLVRSR